MAVVPPPSTSPSSDEKVGTLSKAASNEERKLTEIEKGELAAASDIEAQQSSSFSIDKEKNSTEEEDPYLVNWTGDDDPLNPLNYSSKIKVLTIAMVASLAFLTPTASAMFSPAIPQVMADFGVTSDVLGSFSVSMFIFGYAIGPLFLAPLSELYGRTIVMHIGNVVFTLFQIGCAKANSMGALITLRLFAGIGGSSVLSVGGGIISDMFRKEKIGGATAAFSLGPLIGPVVGPVAGGFVTQALGWRWNFWLLAIFGGTITTLSIFIIPETNPHILLKRRAKKLRKETGDERWHSPEVIKTTATKHILLSLYRPMKLLIFSPIILSLALALGIIFGYVYLLFTTFAEVFSQVYHWSEGLTGLAYLGSGIGFLTGAVIVGTTNDRIVNRLTKKHGVRKPEYRMSVMMWFTPLIPIGMFWYGWSANKPTHWIVPILGTVPLGIGMMGIFLPSFIYSIEAFGFYAASALASLTFFRSVIGTFLPLAGPPLYQNLGLGWGNSVLGFIAVALIPIPILLYRYGEWLRTAHPVNLE